MSYLAAQLTPRHALEALLAKGQRPKQLCGQRTDLVWPLVLIGSLTHEAVALPVAAQALIVDLQLQHRLPPVVARQG